MARFEAPGIEEQVFTTVWIFGKFRAFVWKVFVESKALLSKTFSRLSFLNDLGLKLFGHFDICDMPFPFLAVVKL